MHVARETTEESLAAVREALDAGRIVLVPTDTVYGIAVRADDEAAVARMYSAKGRAVEQPTAVIFPSIDAVMEAFPDLGARAAWAMRALLPGPWTLIIDNPDGRWPWLTGGAPAPIGVRVPAGTLPLPPIAATSANASGQPTATTVDELDPSVAGQVAAAIDRGPLPRDMESTVLDIVAWSNGDGEVRVLRDTAGRAGQALAALADGP